MWHCLPVALGLLLPACNNSTSVAELPPFEMGLQPVFTGLSSLMDLQAPPGDSRLFIAERQGRIRVVQRGVLQATPFLDISNRVTSNHGEAGFLSFAFHPQYLTDPQKQFVFVHFIEPTGNINGDIVVERYQVSANDPNLLDISTVQPVIRIQHRDFDNHYGGRVAFGSDGMLYLSTGDGGGGGDTLMNGQNPGTLLAKLLRLDVSALPGTVTPQIWAIGLRNPFRYAFDAPTGRLYIADVGQGQREEIDVIAAGSAGLNYGWNLMEGLRCFPNGGQCNMTGLTLPVYDYDHTQGCSIIGGYVYRGAAIPELQGQYLFSDFCSGFVRSLSFENGVATVRQAPTVNVGTNVVQSFGQDGAGELYILTGDGRVLRIARQ